MTNTHLKDWFNPNSQIWIAKSDRELVCAWLEARISCTLPCHPPACQPHHASQVCPLKRTQMPGVLELSLAFEGQTSPKSDSFLARNGNIRACSECPLSCPPCRRPRTHLRAFGPSGGCELGLDSGVVYGVVSIYQSLEVRPDCGANAHACTFGAEGQCMDSGGRVGLFQPLGITATSNQRSQHCW